MIENQKPRLEDATDEEIVEAEKEGGKVHLPISLFVLAGVLLICVIVCIIVICNVSPTGLKTIVDSSSK